MTATTVRIELDYDGPTGTRPATGYVECVPSRDDIEGAGRVFARFGAPLLDDDGDVLQAAADGVAWAQLVPTDDGEHADEWAWIFVERIPRGGLRRCCPVPTSIGVVDYADLEDVDPDDLSPVESASPAWSAPLASEAATRASADSAEATARAAADATHTSAIASEAALARDAGNLSSGTIPDARLAAGITRDAEVAALVAAELVTYQPGLEIGYAERTTSATSTQTVPNATGTISGLSVVVVGTGRAVDIRFGAALAWNSVAAKHAFASLMVNAGAGGSAAGSSSPATNTGPALGFTRRMVLTNGVSYTFTVALYTESGGGTVTAFANATYPMSLSVTNR